MDVDDNLNRVFVANQTTLITLNITNNITLQGKANLGDTLTILQLSYSPVLGGVYVLYDGGPSTTVSNYKESNNFNIRSFPEGTIFVNNVMSDWKIDGSEAYLITQNLNNSWVYVLHNNKIFKINGTAPDGEFLNLTAGNHLVSFVIVKIRTSVGASTFAANTTGLFVLTNSNSIHFYNNAAQFACSSQLNVSSTLPMVLHGNYLYMISYLGVVQITVCKCYLFTEEYLRYPS